MPTSPKIIFFGSPDFAATILNALLLADCHIVAVVTQPDQPVGRKQTLTPTAVKKLADERGIPTTQPASLKTTQAVDDLKKYDADLFIVAAYGLIIPQSILDLPSHGCINVHPSLLPHHRGATPIPAAILHGDTVTGTAIMQMDAQMDHGPIITQEKVALDGTETTESLTAKLAVISADLLVRTIPGYIDGTITPRSQDHDLATYCSPLIKADGLITWNQPAKVIDRHIRAMWPWPTAHTLWNNQQLTIIKSHIVPTGTAQLQPGVVHIQDKKIMVGTQTDPMEVIELQLAGKKPMLASAFMNGYAAINGATLHASRSDAPVTPEQQS